MKAKQSSDQPAGPPGRSSQKESECWLMPVQRNSINFRTIRSLDDLITSHHSKTNSPMEEHPEAVKSETLFSDEPQGEFESLRSVLPRA
ncbi:hypothetical protein CONLIGDRAFT_637758 [Coniochaeta ligniaria NRRL 30616]|uniref:Uncharacterized protein n=1 Tax=Coniochaeta ligniaria NRRL 30616 TaxID=1408157 RepID=A0A1J7I7I3_9PEZI|nr:hypothetical protein CONLIGDRAFT_637758 [Coniochaeta ligniaria NRRL 30616]